MIYKGNLLHLMTKYKLHITCVPNMKTKGMSTCNHFIRLEFGNILYNSKLQHY